MCVGVWVGVYVHFLVSILYACTCICDCFINVTVCDKTPNFFKIISTFSTDSGTFFMPFKSYERPNTLELNNYAKIEKRALKDFPFFVYIMYIITRLL